MRKTTGMKLRDAAAFIMFATGGLWLYAATVYYDNSVTKWATPKAYVWTEGGGEKKKWPGEEMIKVSGYDNLWSFDTSSYANVIFDNGMSGNNLRQTIGLTVTEGKVYKMTTTTDKGPTTEFASIEEWAESQSQGGGDEVGDTRVIWLEPANPKVNEKVTLHFNAAAAPGRFKDQQKELNLHIGMAVDFTSAWKIVKWAWDYIGQDNTMTRDVSDPNHYTFEITPTISEFFSLGDDTDVNYIGVIVRDENKNKSQDSDLYIPITRPVDPSSACVGAYQSHDVTGGSLVVKGEWGQLFVTPYSDNIVKIFTLPDAATVREERRSITVCATPQPMPVAVTEDTDTELVLSFGNEQTFVHVNKENCTVTFTDAYGNAILAEQTGIDNRAGKRKVTFAPMNDAAFYGGGYNGARTDWNNVTMEMNNTQKWGWDASTPGSRCINVPFYVSTSGYGVLFDDHFRSSKITPSSDKGTVYSTGSQNPIAYYFVGGDTMDKVMENYTWLTGRQQMPPYWALGYLTSRYGYKSFNETDGYINAIKAAGIPVDGVVFDLYWQGTDESGMGNLDWESSNFGNAPAWLKEKKDDGIHTVIITEPFFTNKSRNYNTLNEKGYFADSDVSNMTWLLSDKVGLLDATQPDALDWMVREYYIPRTREGVDGLWLDLGEPEQHDDDSHHQGGSVSQVHNEFGNLWVESVYNGLRSEFPDMRPMLMPRAGTSGMQRFSTFPWTGDIRRSWSGLQAQIPALVSASMSGIGYIGSDVGGFAAEGYTDANLYLRWVEQSVFTPVIRTHSKDKPEPTHSIYDGIRDDVRRFINLHYQYLPYTYTLAWWNSIKGTPLARPVNMYDANPATLASVTDEYLWGRDILVAPVVNEGESRTVRFPDGKWLDMNDYTRIYTGSTQYSAPLGKLPYFGRVGSFIPRFTDTSFTNTASITHTDYTIDYIADPEGSVTEGFLFEDDRTTPSVNEDYKYLLTKFHGVVEEDKAYIYIWRYDQNDPEIDGTTLPEKEGYTGMADYHTYIFVVHNMPMKVRAGASVRAKAPSAGNSLDEDFVAAGSVDELKASSHNAFFIDNANGKAYIKATLPTATNQILQVSGEGAVMTGVETAEADSPMFIGYAGGILDYSLPADMTDGKIEIYSVSGGQVCRMEADKADGAVHQMPLTIARGIYVARLSATDACGRPAAKHIKIAVR